MEKNELKEMLKKIMEVAYEERSGALRPKENELSGLLGWKKPSNVSSISATGVNIPIKIESSSGSVRVYLSFAPEFAEPQKLQELIQSLISVGVPIDAWKQKQVWGNRRG